MFILELGVTSGEGQFKQWDSQGFYVGYNDKGPVISDSLELAYKFPTYDMAANLPAGDERLRNSRINPLGFYDAK